MIIFFTSYALCVIIIPSCHHCFQKSLSLSLSPSLSLSLSISYENGDTDTIPSYISSLFFLSLHSFLHPILNPQSTSASPSSSPSSPSPTLSLFFSPSLRLKITKRYIGTEEKSETRCACAQNCFNPFPGVLLFSGEED